MDSEIKSLLEKAVSGKILNDTEGRLLSKTELSPLLLETAGALRDKKHHDRISYSRKVFIPLTQLCRDVCHYCTFAQRPRKLRSPYLSPKMFSKLRRMVETPDAKKHFLLWETNRNCNTKQHETL